MRVRASDRLDNPPDGAADTTRLLDAVVLDNAGPVLSIDSVEISGNTATLTGTVSDGHLTIAGLAYRLDGEPEYRPVLPDDLIFDSTEERWTLTLPALTAGGHVVTFRALDTRGNASYAHRVLQVR